MPIPVHSGSLIPKMSMFTLAISCLTTSNLLTCTFGYRFLCNIVLYSIGLNFHHQTHPQLSTAFALALSLHFFWSISPLFSSSILLPTNLGSSSFSVITFCLFILFKWFSRQECWSGLPFPSPVDCILSELSAMTCPSWVALHGMAHSFIELDKAVVHVISLVSFLWLWFPFCLPSDGEG